MKMLNQIWIAPLSFDPGNTLRFDFYTTGSTMDNIARRMGKIRTLDINAVIVDGGYTEADRTFKISVEPVTKKQVDIAQRMVRLHPRVRMSKRDGVWLCAPSDIEVSGKTMTLVIESVEKVSNG